jgi:uncharacterized Zn finger protein (UPF0148 family)
MKTIKKGNEVRRVSEKDAMFFVKNGWNYCPKSEYKTEVKPEPKPKVEEVSISDNISDKKTRKLRKENKRKKHEAKNIN